MGNIFEISETYTGLLTESWIKKVWQTCQQYQIEIKNNTPAGKGLQDHDSKIMQGIVKQGVNNTELLSINCCKMWLQVNYVSKIYMGDSRQTTQMAWEGMEKIHIRYEWPRTQKPTQTEWKTWQWALSIALHLNTQRGLQQPLGKWWGLNKPSWRWYLDKDIL